MPEGTFCKNCNAEFHIREDDYAFYEKMGVPAPTWCPECRRTRRFLWRNLRSLYKDTCDMCGEDMISLYVPGSPYTVYCRSCWSSDKWEALEFGKEYDPERSFFDQFGELILRVPRIGLLLYGNPVNVSGCNSLLDGKNLYLSYSILSSEDSLYCQNLDRSRNAIDCIDAKEIELCYENIECTKNYRCHHMVQSRDCIDSAFLYDAVNSQNCFMSSNIRNNQYVFRNQQLSKAEYELAHKEAMSRGALGLAELRSEFKVMIKKALHKYADINRSEDATGNTIDRSNQVHASFNVNECERVAYSDRLPWQQKDAYDAFGGRNSELLLEGIISGSGSYNIKFYHCLEQCRDVAYSDWCQNSTNLFGCTGVRKKQFCILNKQYSEEEYASLKKKIIEDMKKRGEYGEFFPKELAPFAYNETMAQEYAPLSKEDALSKGFVWRDMEAKKYGITMPTPKIPKNIEDVTDVILNETLGCRHAKVCNDGCTAAFRIIPAELVMLREFGLPLPVLCPNCRHGERLTYRKPFKLWERKCSCDYRVHTNSVKHSHHETGPCPNTFQTSYAPDRPEVVYCEVCYQAEIA